MTEEKNDTLNILFKNAASQFCLKEGFKDASESFNNDYVWRIACINDTYVTQAFYSRYVIRDHALYYLHFNVNITNNGTEVQFSDVQTSVDYITADHEILEEDQVLPKPDPMPEVMP